MTKSKIVFIIMAILLIILMLIACFIIIMQNKETDPVSPKGLINFLKQATITYYENNGELPKQNAWKEDLRIYVLNESNFIDMWGIDIKYVKDDNSFRLYSCGRNKSDDNGNKDDIRLDYYVKTHTEVWYLGE